MANSMAKNEFSPAERLIKDRPLPLYSYVPGMHPHPIREENGHSFRMEISVSNFDPDNWRDRPEFLFGIDLFNFGYYWEAHESWEAVWIAAGRSGIVADFLKGLIKLAAAGVKAREGNENGVRRHAARAAQLFGETSAGQEALLGLLLTELLAFSDRLGEEASSVLNTAVVPVKRVWDFVLVPGQPGDGLS
jgi:predicted metal-dependent hydrolase